MTKNTRFSPEVRQRAVRMVLESQGEYDSQWAAICSIAPKIGCTPETLRVWVRQHLWGGGSHRPWKRHSCWMHWSRRYGPVDRPARSITVIKVLSMYRWPTHSGLRKPDYWHQQEVQATRMTTRWRRASMVFTKRR